MNDRTDCVHILVNRFRSNYEFTLSRIFVNNQLICFGSEKHGADAIDLIPIGFNRVVVDWEDIPITDTERRLGRLKIIDPNFPGATIRSSERPSSDAAGSLTLGTTLRAIPTKKRIIGSDIAFKKLFSLVATSGERNLLRIIYRNSTEV